MLHPIKNPDLITNCTGKNLCYTLTKHPSQITMLDIQKSIEPIICVVDCLSPHFSCDRNGFCSAKDFWGKLNNQIIEYFRSVTLQDMIADQRKKPKRAKNQTL
jgi:DNA-binding IscR family transcriptional regulator